MIGILEGPQWQQNTTPSTETLRAAITVHLLTQWIAIFPNSICESVLYVTFFMISDWTTYLYKMSLYFFSFSLFTATNLDLIFLLPFDPNGCQIPAILLKQNSKIFFQYHPAVSFSWNSRLFCFTETAGCCMDTS